MIYLASQSPRRRELLRQLGVDFEVLNPDIDETALPGEAPEDLVRRLALAKARAGLAMGGDGNMHVVLGADTIVVLDGKVLGKPRDAAHAGELIMSLSDRCHRVLSAVALVSRKTNDVRLSASRVCLRALSERECAAYVATGEPLDKAGGYGIQGFAAAFVSDLQGSYSGVVGLPLYETAELLREAGIEVLRSDP